jgi:hypothetical protein
MVFYHLDNTAIIYIKTLGIFREGYAIKLEFLALLFDGQESRSDQSPGHRAPVQRGRY